MHTLALAARVVNPHFGNPDLAARERRLLALGFRAEPVARVDDMAAYQGWPCDCGNMAWTFKSYWRNPPAVSFAQNVLIAVCPECGHFHESEVA
jgi:hypothetical protein